VVGECFKYHAHGDKAIYDSMVRMTQYFNVGIPLITGQGNWGNIDAPQDNAAMRYTECKLSAFSEEVLFKDISEKTVEFVDNFTGEFREPLVLPARIPIILLTGASGIAVGMSTNIPPHSLKEICNGILLTLRKDTATVKDYMKYIPCPDFPLGGEIQSSHDLTQAYSSGNGSTEYKATYKMEGRTIVFVSIPYGIDKSSLISEMAKLVRDEKLEGISEIRDETVKSDIRICIEVKRGFDCATVVKNIYKATDLMKKYSINMIAIVDKKPKLVGLEDIFRYFISFRRDVVEKRTLAQKQEAEDKFEIVDAVIKMIENSDEALKIIKTSDEPVKKLQERFLFNDRQGHYVYNMPVKKFSKTDTKELTEEKKDLLFTIKEKEEILSDKLKIDGIIEKETKEISKNFGYERRTIFIP
jgi:DNA gyrase subunit A